MAPEKKIICFPFLKAEFNTTSTRTTTNVHVDCCRYPIWLLWTAPATVCLATIVTILLVILQHKSHPQYTPSFHVTALNITQLNFTRSATNSSTQLISKLNVTIVVQNPNKNATFIFDTLSFDVSSYGILLGNESLGGPSGLENQANGVFHASISKTTIIDPNDYYHGNEQVAFDFLIEEVHLKHDLPLKITGTTDVRVMLGGKMRKAVQYQICCPSIRVIPDHHSSSSSMWELSKGYIAECYTY